MCLGYIAVCGRAAGAVPSSSWSHRLGLSGTRDADLCPLGRALRRGVRAPSGGQSWPWGEHPDRTERVPSASPADEASVDQEVNTGTEARGVAEEEHSGTD